MSLFVDRMIRAAKLDVQLYEEVEADPSAMTQAMNVVVLAGVAAGIGSSKIMGVSGIIWGSVSALAGWFIWSYITYIVGTKLLPEPQTKANYGELLRTIGFSSSPGLIRVLGILPGLGGIVVVGSSIWMLAAMVIAVRQALDFRSTGRAIGVCLVGWIIQGLAVFLFFSIFGGLLKAPR
jgi:hypothetical protein